MEVERRGYVAREFLQDTVKYIGLADIERAGGGISK